MQIWTPEPTVDDGEFTVRPNPGAPGRDLFAVIELSEFGGTALVMHSAADCDRLIRAAEAAKQLLTAGEDEDAFCEQRGPGGRFRCTLARGHASRHEAGGTAPLATWHDGDTEFTYEPEDSQS